MDALPNRNRKSSDPYVAGLGRADFAILMAPLAFASALLALFILSEGTVSPSLTADLLVAAVCLLTVIVLTEASVLAGLGVVALAGTVQAAAAIWFPVPVTLYLDNLPFLLTMVYAVTIAVKWRLVAELRILTIVLILVGIALFRAGTTSAALYQARQVLFPFLIAFAAFVAIRLPVKNPAYKPRIDILIKITVGLAWVTCVYMLAEYIWGPPLNPLAAYKLNPFTEHFAIIDGYLGNYLFYPGNTGHAVIRLGGLLMNPPVAGIFMGGSAVIAFWQYWHRRHVGMLILCVASILAMLGTYARGGTVVAVVGIGFPLLIRYTNRTFAVIVIAIVAIYLGAKIGQEGSSLRHYDGLAAGLSRAFHHPFGQGLDTIGDVSTRAAGSEGEGESLAAIPFAAIGLPAVALYLAALWGSFRGASIQNWPAALGLGILICALFTESASSLSGTIIVWSFCGIGLALGTKREPFVAGLSRHRPAYSSDRPVGAPSQKA